MTRILMAGAVCLLMVGCGGGGARVDRSVGGADVSFARGPISEACLRAGRKAANARLCRCVQGVANGRLNGADQSMAAGFFADPHQAQVIRQSDDRRHEAFWDRYKAFTARAEQVCRGL